MSESIGYGCECPNNPSHNYSIKGVPSREIQEYIDNPNTYSNTKKKRNADALLKQQKLMMGTSLGTPFG